MTKAPFIVMVLLFSLTACDKVDNPSYLLDCVELRDWESKDDFGNLEITLDGSTYVLPCKINERPWGTYNLFWYQHDETCYGTSSGIIANFIGEENREFTAEIISSKCAFNLGILDSVGSTREIPYVRYDILDHDVPISNFSVNFDRYDLEFRLVEYNKKRSIMRGEFSGTLYLDQRCVPDSLKSLDTVRVIERAVFEAPVVIP